MTRRDLIANAALALCWLGASTRAGATAQRAAPLILVLGDSLSAEYGLKRGSGWVALLQQRLLQQKFAHSVVNASISGETTAGARSRLAALLALHHPTHVILELGGNDALRGLPLAMTQENLDQLTLMSQASGAKVLLLGMQVPPNYGADYARAFAATYVTVATKRKAALLPFLLRGVADRADAEQWFQPDRIHPREEAQILLLNNVWPELKKLLP